MKRLNLQKTAIYAESWNVAFRKMPCGTILTDTNTPFTIIENAARYWAADPFILEQDGQVYIFAELYDYILRRGVLGHCKIEDGSPTKWVPVIEEPYHLSYPCVMKQRGKIFLIPESGEGNELSLYEAVDFPNKWRKQKVLRQDVKFADTTPFPAAGAQFALTHQVDDPGNPRLTLIDLERKHGDTTITDAAPFRSRPAGHVFQWNDHWVRPAQFSENCGDGYGKGLIFYRCQLSDDLNYIETEIKKIHPEDYKYDRPIFLDGMHTYNASEHYEVIDIKTRRFNLLNLFMRVVGKFLNR